MVRIKLRKVLASFAAVVIAGTGAMLGGGTAAYAGPDDIIAFKEAHFQKCVNAALKQAEGTAVTRAQMESLTSLSCDEQDVSSAPVFLDLGGIEAAINLESLYFNWNGINDLRPIAGLSKLKTLTVSNSRVKDLAPLSGLKGLETLTLSNNSIDDVSPLKDLPALTQLNLSRNQITDASALGSVKTLTTLSLNGNRLTQVDFVSTLTQLTSLDLAMNSRVTDLTPVKALTNLTTLQVHQTNIADLAALTELTKLKYLSMFGTAVSDLSPLKNLSELETLYANSLNPVATGHDAVVTVPIVNTVRDIDGKPVSMTDQSYCVGEECAQLVYPTAGDEVSVYWDTKIVLGAKEFAFSGILKRKVLAEGPPVISGEPTPGRVGVPYSYQFDVYGSPAPTVSVTKGKLPKGLELSPAGALTGTPELNGTFDFTVSASNGFEPAATVKVSLSILERETPLVSPEITLGSNEVRRGDTVTVSGVGFVPGETVAFTMYSDPVTLPAAKAGADGKLSLTFQVPNDTAFGAHRVEATRGQAVIAVARFTVVAGDTTTTSPNGGGTTSPGTTGSGVLRTSASGLARTGAADAFWPFAVSAAALLLGGAAAAGGALRKRNRRAMHAGH